MATERTTPTPPVPGRERILVAALKEFGGKGFHGGSTAVIAQGAGDSQAGLFRRFPTKKDLFVAVLERTFATIERQILSRAEGAPADCSAEEADTWGASVDRRDLMLLLVQGYAACGDPGIRELMYRWTRGTFDRMDALPRAGAVPDRHPFAAGVLYMVASCMDLPARGAGDAWVDRFLSSGAWPWRGADF